MSTQSIIAEPYDDGWRGREVHDDGYPAHMGSVLYGAVTGHFEGDIRAARGYFLHEHTGWRSIGGDFAQPTGYVRVGPGLDASADDLNQHRRRNQCQCHGDRQERAGWIYNDDPNDWAEYAYVLGDTTMVVEVPGHRDDVWWQVAQVRWGAPAPDWEHLHAHDYR